VPPQAITQRHHCRDQFGGFFLTVVFQIQDRPATLDCLARAGQHGGFHAFDIGLDQMTARQAQAVDGDDGNRLAGALCQQRKTAEVVVDARIGRLHDHLARCAADALLPGDDVRALVQRQVGAQRLEHDALWFKGIHQAFLADQLGQQHGVRADIGAGFDRHIVRVQQTAEHRGFAAA
jgi:acetolactate synthase regulatory subunit